MKFWITLAATVFFTYLCHAQYRSEKITYMDGSGNKTPEKSATLLRQWLRRDDTTWEIYLYQAGGPRTSSIQYNDETCTTLNGLYLSYDGNGQVDTMGRWASGRKEGSWSIYSGGRFVMNQLYENGSLLWQKDTLRLKQEADSLKARGKAESGEKTFTKVEIESSFPGGAKGWLKYLQSNFQYPDKAVKKLIQGMVVVGFVVDKMGKVEGRSIWVDQSVEYSIDKEAQRIIYQSPEWNPAEQGGQKVKSYKKQPVIFKLQTGK